MMTKLIVCTVVAFAAVIMSSNALPPPCKLEIPGSGCVDEYKPTDAQVPGGIQVDGGLGESKPTDAEVAELVEQQRANIVKKICDNGSVCPSADAKIAVNGYKTQLVAGTNYFVSLTIDDVIYHVRIFKSFTGTVEVHAVQGPKTVDDEILHFD